MASNMTSTNNENGRHQLMPPVLVYAQIAKGENLN